MVAKKIEEENFKNSNKKQVFLNNMKADIVQIHQEGWLNKVEIIDLKMEFLDDYFTVEFVDYGSANSRTYGKSFDFVHAAKTKESKSVIKGLWGRYKHHFEGDYEAFFCEIMACVSSAVIQFNESQSTYSYSHMNEKGSSENLRLHAYIVKPGKTGISVLESLLQKYTNFIQWKERSGDNINEFNITSFDAVTENEDGDEITLGETLGEDSGLYYYEDSWRKDEEDSEEIVYHSNYHKPHFIVYFYQWFDEQKRLRASKDRDDHSKAELTATQITYFDEWKEVFLGELAYGIPKFDDEYAIKLADRKKKKQRIYSNDESSKFNKEIRERYEKHYDSKFPNGVSFLRMKLMEDKEVLDEAVNIINQEPVHNPKLGKIQKKSKSDLAREEELSKWILANFKNEGVVRDIIYSLSGEHLGDVIEAQMTRTVIKKEALYSFINAVGDRLDEIEDVDALKYEKWYERDEKPKQMKREDTMNSDVRVYQNGELVEVIEQKDIKQKEKNYKMKRTMPNGLKVELGDNDF
ncbi:hypothetical protein [Sporosarcina beigongshangi]|uniref:hypothetical protein n=1 Tax=Sporosarcina beigongshangi TaxID=2782538 RepID=UPI001939AE01|nr:hypothetical protein [Sporosarcina beigongshangi]